VTSGAASGANPLRRAFVAVVPPASVLDALEQFVRSAPVSPGPGVRWSPRAQWHLTLRFLGPVAAAEPLGAALREALAREAPGTTALGGAGAFPSIAKASVVWIGVREGVDTLARLAAVVDRVVVGCGFVAESRPFRPHLTVGRLRSPGPVRGLVGPSRRPSSSRATRVPTAQSTASCSRSRWRRELSRNRRGRDDG
jgi:RNA 2',3'-cyclic 3'-phosphodiesterase